ncbi:MAG: hypothetical protein IKU37_09410 [Candidatus Gastranaerophilales bacterium]|nr:hypothetical protein [Candidatus Gastranaerophilales bacterium]
MEFTFENLLATNIVNFIIVIATLAFIFKKARLVEVISKLAIDVKNDIEKSATSAANALKEYKQTKKDAKNTPKLQEEIIEQAKSNAYALGERSKLKTQIQKEEIEKSVEKIFQKQEDKAKKITTNEIYLACIELAQDQVIQKLDNDMHKKLINSSIDELDKIEGSLF